MRGSFTKFVKCDIIKVIEKLVGAIKEPLWMRI